MKKTAFLILALLASSWAYAQSADEMKKLFGPQRRSCDGPGGPKTARILNLTGFGLQIGKASDAFGNFTHFRLLDMATVPAVFDQIELDAYTSSYKATLSGTFYSLYASIRPFNPSTRLINSNHELRVGISYLKNRTLALRYSKEAEWIDFHLEEDEIALSAAYLIGGGTDNWKIYGGPFINAGKASKGNLYANASSDPAVGLAASNTKGASMMRLGAQLGTSYNIIPQLAITFDVQLGKGWRFAKGEVENPTVRYSSSWAIGLRADLY
jgi:hypothetical protein